ncbi:MAG: putative zinc-binding protein [Anaerolineales bacterium]
MVDLPRKKVGIVACSGEEIPEGTVTRLAALRVLEQLRPNDTVTICLPLFLAGGEGDRAFAKFYPTISVDGCELHCAQRATEKYSNTPAASIMVRDLIEENKLELPEGKRRLNAGGLQAVEVTAEKITDYVDILLGKHWERRPGKFRQLETINVPPVEFAQEPNIATCACGSGIPVQTLIISGKEVTLVGLPLILQQFTEAEKAPNEANIDELFKTIKIYNQIPAEEESGYREGISKAYRDYWFKGNNR